MVREIRYFTFVIIIFIFIFFSMKYYFSDENKKKSFRSLNNIDNKINEYSKKIKIIESDNKNIIEYAEEKNSKKKKYNFWKLLDSNE